MTIIKSHNEQMVIDYREFQKQVVLFNELAGNDVNDESKIPLYHKLLLEELDETFDALNKDNFSLVGFYDGIGDTFVVGEWLARLYGKKDGLLTDFVADTGMMKIEPNAHYIHDDLRSIYSILVQRDGLFTPEALKAGVQCRKYTELLQAHEQLKREAEEKDAIAPEYDGPDLEDIEVTEEDVKEETAGRETTLRNMLTEQLQWLLASFSDVAVNRKGILMEIMKSNMSKFVPEHNMLDEDADKECHMIEAEGRYKGVVWERKNGYYVFKDENSKVVKPSHYFKPNIAAFLEV